MFVMGESRLDQLFREHYKTYEQLQEQHRLERLEWLEKQARQERDKLLLRFKHTNQKCIIFKIRCQDRSCSRDAEKSIAKVNNAPEKLRALELLGDKYYVAEKKDTVKGQELLVCHGVQ